MTNNKQSIIKIERDNYTLLLSENPCQLFEYFNVDEMHGLSLTECKICNIHFDDQIITDVVFCHRIK